MPILVTPAHVLIDGRHRLAAGLLLAWDFVRVEVVELSALHAELAEIDANIMRNDGTELERANELKRRKEIYEALYPETMKGVAGAHASNKVQGNEHNANEIISFASDTASKTGKSARSIQQSTQIATNIPADVQQAIANTSVADSKTELLTLARLEWARMREVAGVIVSGAATGVSEALDQLRRFEAAQTSAPTGKYRCIVIDPPWNVKKIEREVRPNQSKHLDYPTMTLDEIAALPVPDLALEDGCHLYVWTTQKYLPDALRLVEGWGFRYQCLMTWVKPGGMTPYSWMYNTEHVIFARRGNLSLLRNGLKLSFEAAATGHSVKPNVFYERVATASPEPRLEMFARQPREQFSVWGSEV